jgi:hypothetical protein
MKANYSEVVRFEVISSFLFEFYITFNTNVSSYSLDLHFYTVLDNSNSKFPPPVLKDASQ